MSVIAASVIGGGALSLIASNRASKAQKDAAGDASAAQVYGIDRSIEAAQQATNKAVAAAQKGNKTATAAQVEAARQTAGAEGKGLTRSRDAQLGAIGASRNALLTGARDATRETVDATRDAAGDRLQGLSKAREDRMRAVAQGKDALTGATRGAADIEARGVAGVRDSLVKAAGRARDQGITGVDEAEGALLTGALGSRNALVDANKQNIKNFRSDFAAGSAGLAPWRTAGTKAIETVSKGLADGSFSMDKWKFEADPGYQFRLDEGNKALSRSAAAAGGLLSGNQLAAAADFNSGLAAQEYGAAWARGKTQRDTDYQMLMGVADRGQDAVNDTNAMRTATTDKVAGATLNIGDARSDYQTSRGNIRAGAATDRAGLRMDATNAIGTARADFAADRAAVRSGEALRIGDIRAGAADARGEIGANTALDRAGVEADRRLAVGAARAGYDDKAALVRAGAATDRGNVLSQTALTRADIAGRRYGAIGDARAQGALNIANASATGAANMGNVIAQGERDRGAALAGRATGQGAAMAAGAQGWAGVLNTGIGNYLTHSMITGQPGLGALGGGGAAAPTGPNSLGGPLPRPANLGAPAAAAGGGNWLSRLLSRVG